MSLSKERAAQIDTLTKEWIDKGLLIEAGWRAFVIVAGLTEAPQFQRDSMRQAYFCGAQHLFASIISTLDPGSEPTDKDLERINLISQELERFVETLRKPRNP